MTNENISNPFDKDTKPYSFSEKVITVIEKNIPPSYEGKGGKYLKVKADESGTEWAEGGGGGGTTNYNSLTNKPQINGVELVGNKTSSDLNITGLPSATVNGTGAVYYNGGWKIQEGYGYSSPQNPVYTKANFECGSYADVGFVELTDFTTPASSLETIYFTLGGIYYKDYSRVDNAGISYYGSFDKSTWLPVLTDDDLYAFKYDGSKWYIATLYQLLPSDVEIGIPGVTVKFSDTLISPAYEGDMETGMLYQQGFNSKAVGINIDDIGSNTLETTNKTLVAAINENRETILGISGGIRIEVVDELPETMTDNTIYYVKQAGSEPPIYDIKLHTTGTTVISLGSTQLDVSGYVKKENTTSFSIKAGTKEFTNDTTAGWLKWNGEPIVTNTLRNYGFTNVLTSSARWNISINNYSHTANDYIVEERVYGATRTIDGGTKYGVSKVTEMVNCNSGVSIAIEEFTQNQNSNLTTHNVWVKKFYYGTTSGDFSGAVVSETDWIRINAPIEDNLTTEDSNVALSAKQGVVLSQEKQDKYIGKDKAFNQVVVDENGYITAADTIYSIKIYKNKAETSGAGVVEISSTKAGLDLSTYEARLAVIQKYARHCLVTAGMKKITYVNETNFLKDVDGNTVTLDGTQGDFMLEVDKLFWKCYDYADYYEWKFSTYTFDEGCMSAHLNNGKYRKHSYYGVFEGYYDGTRLRSINTSSTTTSGSGLPNVLWSRAREGGTSMGAYNTYGVYCMPDISLIGILHVFLYATKDIQSIVKGSNFAGNVVINDSFSATGGWTQGTTDDYEHGCMTMGIMNFFGNAGFMIGNAIGVGNHNIVFAKDTNDFYNISGGSSGVPSTWVSAGVDIPGTSSSTWNFTKDINGSNTLIPIAPRLGGGSNSTYFCDGTISSTGDRTVYYGGAWNEVGAAGIFCFNLYQTIGRSGSNRVTMRSVD